MEDIITSFEYGVPAAIIMALYLILIKIIDAKKEKQQGKISSNLVESFTRLNNFLEYFTKDIIEKDRDKCEFAIKNSFNSFSDSLIEFSVNTIINNNVEENKQTIIGDINHLVSTEYWNVYSNLILFNSIDCRVSDYLEDDWKQEITTEISDIIFDTTKTKEQRIYSINKKVHITINSFCVHVINRYAKHNN